jgi:ribosome-associated toxin RatA of RatAB toxin-antitoxin module
MLIAKNIKHTAVIIKQSSQKCNTIVNAFSSRSTNSRTHNERRLLKFSSEQLFNVVSNVKDYNKFVPWCKESNVLKETSTDLEAELVVGFGYFNEKYISIVKLNRPKSVIAESKQTNLLEYLKTEWSFAPTSNDPKKCWVTFKIDFKFKSPLYNQVSDLFLQDVINRMVKAFEEQCRKEFAEKTLTKDTCN